MVFASGISAGVYALTIQQLEVGGDTTGSDDGETSGNGFPLPANSLRR